MEARATARTVLLVPRKARLVTRIIQGKSVAEASDILNNMNKKSARLINKVLISATANAPILKRHRFGSRGHIDRHDKKTSHITIVVAKKN